jgi:glyceraldehyde 3-phosphate dehydrogenase
MTGTESGKRVLGINGFGRIGKLLLWNRILAGGFDAFVVNIGREAGRSVDDIVQSLVRDSTYGSIDTFFHGHSGKKVDVRVISREEKRVAVAGKEVAFLTGTRNPAETPGRANGARIVADCTGKFLDPSDSPSATKGNPRDHLRGGADTVVVSAPFSAADPAGGLPEDSVMLVYGVNNLRFDPARHRIVSAASCTTTGLSHMIKPLLENRETANILTASMSTVHAATNTQSILDEVPKAGARDLRKTRSVFNNIILTSTGAAGALEEILPEIGRVGFMADSVRIPVNTVSMISLNVTFRTALDRAGDPVINRKLINEIYAQAAAGPQRGLLVYSETQNVSSDFAGFEAAVVIEGNETHSRTSFLEFSASDLAEMGFSGTGQLRVPVTHAKIVGWYDNEYGCYVTTMGRLVEYVAEQAGYV